MKKRRKVFTIGSCFARNIEDFLQDFDVPTTRFAVDASEWPSRPNGILNEYNPGTIAQRLNWSAQSASTVGMSETLVGPAESCADLLLPRSPDVTLQRARERRGEIDQLYAELPGSDFVIITLGLTECWYDDHTGTFLNRMPPEDVMRAQKGRYVFVNLGFQDCVNLLTRAFEQVTAPRGRHVILTVSPVPLQTTFTGQDCYTANMRSKSVLRAVADEIVARFPGKVDYFPSYEIVMSGGTRAFGKDNVHVFPKVIGKVMDHLFANYL
ncbi:GSCFA domain-containing protein [Paracoccus aminophilus]|nr:GSCFA domain-containing protein [Paracoccus aminophilus]